MVRDRGPELDVGKHRSGRERRAAERRSLRRATAGRRRGERRGSTTRTGLLLAALSLFPQVRSSLSLRSASGLDELAPAPPPLDPAVQLEGFIEEASALYGVSADLVRAVIQTESGFNPRAVSPVGALGLMQLMPDTAEEVGVTDPLDPRQNIFGGVKYLSALLERFNGNVSLALAGYNAGPRAVQRHKGIPPFRETRGYVKKIQGLLADIRPDTLKTDAD